MTKITKKTFMHLLHQHKKLWKNKILHVQFQSKVLPCEAETIILPQM